VNQQAEYPSVVDIIRFLQAKNGVAIHPPQPSDRVGFALSSKDRPEFTRKTIEGLDADGGFDIVWNDGSETAEGTALPYSIQFKNARLVEVNHDVRGGPDRSICFGLERLLKLGYDYVGLIENDVVLQPGWSARLMNLFTLAAADGLACGAATVRSYESRVMEHRAGYSINWATGAGMVLFSRLGAQVILENYGKLMMTAAVMRQFYARLFSVDLRLSSYSGRADWETCPLTLDWGYTPRLYIHGYASVGSIPSLAYDLEFEPGHYLLSNYVGPERNNTGLIHPRICVTSL